MARYDTRKMAGKMAGKIAGEISFYCKPLCVSESTPTTHI